MTEQFDIENDEFEDADPEDDETTESGEVIRAKWTMDGASTLEECIQLLLGKAEMIRGLQAEGWELIQPVTDDYGFLRKVT